MTAGERVGVGQVERFFDGAAAAYDREYARGGAGGRVLRRRLTATLDLLGERTGEVLDVGMGGGVLCEALDARGWRVSGVDLSAEMVETARTRLPHLRERLSRASIFDLPFGEGRFDAVVATGVLEYATDDLDGALRELTRVLRPHGVAVVSYPNTSAPVTAWRGQVLYPVVRRVKAIVPWGAPPPPATRRVAAVTALGRLELAGLVLERLEPVGARPLPPRLAARLEAGGSAIARMLAVQLVARARKRG